MTAIFAIMLMLQQQQQREQFIAVVPAIQYETPASYPCNKSVGNELSCITGPETHWACVDWSRVMITTEDGRHLCVSLKMFQGPGSLVNK